MRPTDLGNSKPYLIMRQKAWITKELVEKITFLPAVFAEGIFVPNIAKPK